MASIVASIVSFVFPPKPGQTKSNPIQIKAVPGLTTFLDHALFQANEGQLTATICSSHALLSCWLDIKRQSQELLQLLIDEKDSPQKILCESFVRQSLESAMDAMERLSTDKLAQSANLSDAYESTTSGMTTYHYSHLLSGVGAQGIATGILEGKDETGRRTPSLQRRRDCWESPRLQCPDFCWADDSFSACQRWIRNMIKHPYFLKEIDTLPPLSSGESHKSNQAASTARRPLSSRTERQVSLLIQLIQDDLPMRLLHFKQAMEAEAVVTKRLYLVKCEYRAPFRAFLEAHQSLLKAPPMSLVESRLDNQGGDVADYKAKLQKLLQTPELIELLILERECEQLELDMGQALFPFTELARSLDHKKARLTTVRGLIDEVELADLQVTTRRLKSILCRKAGSETSTGIRPLLMDLRGIPRDDELPQHLSKFAGSNNLEDQVDHLLSQLHILSVLLKTRKAFVNQKQQKHDIDFSLSILKGCTDEFDPELLKCQLLDWFTIVDRQRELVPVTGNLPEEIRQAEMALSIAGAPGQSLGLVKERLEKMQTDRQQRLDVLKDMVEELCLREMNICIDLSGPDPHKILELKPTSASGIFGIPLQMAMEELPIG